MTQEEKTTPQRPQERAAEQKARMEAEQARKLNNYRAQNLYIRKGQTLFTGSSLMEMFPITEFCLNEGLPIAYNRGVGGFTTDQFLAAIKTVLLDVEPARLFINIGTNDIARRADGEDWLDHLSRNYRKICEIIREKLPDTDVYMMAYYPVNAEAALAKGGFVLNVRTNENVNRANHMVEALANEFGFRYIDVNGGLKDENGSLKIEHTVDGIHFDSAAYRTVFERRRPYLG
jgi:lysophospholipase L1-like esterase